MAARNRLLCGSKKGMSAHQLWRQLGFGSYRTAWFMAHRIREAHLPDQPMGGEGKFETYVGGKGGAAHANLAIKPHSGSAVSGLSA